MLRREVGFSRRRQPAALGLLLVLGAGAHWVHARIAEVRDYDPIAEARATAQAYALDAYPRWREHRHSSDRECPRTLDELGPYLERAAPSDPWRTSDPWGQTFEMSCDFRPDGHLQYLWIRSAGPDRALGTADDIASHW